MLILDRVEIANFACFEHLDVRLAREGGKHLTVIRAENGSGKTTFLRALRWAFYGDKGLPGDDPSVFSVHPAWWTPSRGQVETKVSITFETDGGTRHGAGASNLRTFQLTRSVATVARDVARQGEPDFRRLPQSLTLLERSTSGGWAPFREDQAQVEETVNLLLPWGLRDFFFMDADEATDFVGGRENRPLPKKAVLEKTTASINELLGLETFAEAMKRVEDLQRELRREVSRASRNVSLKELDDELEDLRTRISQLDEAARSTNEQLADLDSRQQRLEAELQQALKDTGAHDQLEKRLVETKGAREKADKQRIQILDHLSTALEAGDLLSGLMIDKVLKVHDDLQPLHQRGLIPLTHVPFVRERLRQEECICGESLVEGTSHRANVEALLGDSVAQEEHANLLGQLFQVSGGFLRTLRSQNNNWAARVDSLRSALGALDADISDLQARREDLDRQIDEIDRDLVQALKGEIDAVKPQIDSLKGQLVTTKTALVPLRQREAELDKTIAQRQKREQIAQDKQAAAQLAMAIHKALSDAYRRIQEEQVAELSSTMNQLFARMAANVPDDDFGRGEEEKATVRMIADVGVSPAAESAGQFEIYARNQRGRTLPPVEINGASRRVLALSFILALSKESKTDAPLVADSLLNMMSGRVRSNSFKTTVEAARQPILLLTRADLAEPAEVDLVTEHGGRVYTVTGQWDVADGASGGDVVNRTSDRQVAILCECGPRQFCRICMRIGDELRSGWTKRPESA